MRDYINMFYDLANEANNRGEHDYATAMENAGSMVNNVAHGIPALDWLPWVIAVMEGNVEKDWDWATEGHRSGWRDAADFLNSEINLLESRGK